MSKIQLILIIATIILFATGLWPIAIGTLLTFIIVKLFEKKSDKKENQESEIDELRKRIEELEKGR